MVDGLTDMAWVGLHIEYNFEVISEGMKSFLQTEVLNFNRYEYFTC
jgi:hypothetical protein